MSQINQPKTSDLQQIASLHSYKYRKVKSLSKLFHLNASSTNANGEPLMTQQDFIHCLSPSEEYQRKYAKELATLFAIALEQPLSSLPKDKETPLLSLPEFIAFHHLMNKPNAEYEVAFRLYNPERHHEINIPTFNAMFHSTPANARVSLNSDVLIAYFQAHHNEEPGSLSFSEFSQLMSRVPHERIRQNFIKYDVSHSGSISLEQLRALVSELANHRISNKLLHRLDRISDLANGRISYTATQALFNVIINSELVQVVLEHASTYDDKRGVDKNELITAEKKLLKRSFFTPLEMDIIYALGSVKKDVNHISMDSLKVLWKRVGTLKELPASVDDEELGWGLSFLKKVYGFGLGSIAGAVGATVVYPIDLVKTRLQNQRSVIVGELMYKNSLDCFFKVIRNEGIFGLYSGLIPQLIGVAPEKAIKLTMNDLMRGVGTDKRTGKITLPWEILAGGVAGGSQVIFTNPLEIVKIRLQVQGKALKAGENLVRKSALTIVRELGLLGLYKGAGACLLRDIPFSAIYFPVYSHLKTDLFHETPEKRLSIGELLSAGAIAGMPAAYFTTPADVIKTRLQVEVKKGERCYSGIIDAFRTILKEEGPRAFFKGGPARVVRSSPQFGVTLMTYELLQNAFPFKQIERKFARDDCELGITFTPNAIKLLADVNFKFGVPYLPSPAI